MNNTEDAKKIIRARWTISLLTFAVGVLLLILKFWAYNFTGSKAILSDSLESIVNVVAAALTMMVIKYANKPADHDHPYGHGKAEFFSAAFEGGLIAFAGLAILYDAIRALMSVHKLNHLTEGLIVIILAGLVNGLLGLYLVREGRKNHSAALEAGGRHLISDAYTTIAVLVGLALVQFTGLVWLDPATAIIAAGILLLTGHKMMKKSFSALMDQEDLGVLSHLREVFEKCMFPGLIQIHHVKVIRSGWHHHVDAHLVVPQYWNVEQAHEQLDIFEGSALRHYGQSCEFNFHLDPCRKAYCKYCDVASCAIRVEKFEQRRPVLMEELRSPNEPEHLRKQS